MSMVGWELGVDGDIAIRVDGELENGADFGTLDESGVAKVGYIFDKEDIQDIEAINTYIVDLSRKVDGMVAEGKLTRSKYDKFFKLFDDWKSFYKYLQGSWYISAEDVNVAKKKRDDINMTIQPEATKQAQKYSAQAKGGIKAEKYEAETKSFLQRNWLPILGVTLAGGAAVYVSGALLGYLQLAKKSGIIRALGH